MFRRRNVVLAVFALVALFLAGCTGGTGTITYGSTAQGYIFYDFANDDILIQSSANPPANHWSPLEDATVHLYRNNTFVGKQTVASNGWFGFEELTRADYDLLVYQPDSWDVFVFEPKGVSFRLNRTTYWVDYQTQIHYLLAGVSADVDAMYNALSGNTMYVGELRRLNGNINAYDVLREIRRIGETAGPNDDFVFYFSGYTRGGSGERFDYIYFGDDLRDDRTAGNFLTDGELEDEIFAYFERATVIIDGTDAASFADGTVRPRPSDINPLAFQDRVYTLMGASRSGEFASTIESGPGAGLGLFTYALAEGLTRAGTYMLADANRDRTVTSYELDDFVYDFMTQYYRDNADDDDDADEHLPVHVGFETVIMRY